MSKLLTVCIALAFLVGCAKEEVSIQVVEEPIIQEQAAVSSPMLVEFMWCKDGADFSPDSFAVMVAEWNALDAASTNQAAGAFVLVPEMESTDFDRIWANIWSSQDARDAGWKEWLENDAADFGAKYDSVMACNPERVFLFESERVVSPSVAWEGTGPFPARYSFCNLNEGKTEADVAAAIGQFQEWVAAGREATGGNGFMSTNLTPQFDPSATEGATSVDSYQGAFWGSAEERTAGMAGWMAKGNAAREAYEAVFSCDDVDFDLLGVKALRF